MDPLGLASTEGTCLCHGGATAPISKIMQDEIRSQPKGQRPDPSRYLPQEYIDTHLKQFESGASYFVPTDVLDTYGRNKLGMPDNTQFVMPTSQLNDVIKESGGDIVKLEEIMGIPEGSWQGKQLSIIDVSNPVELNLRMPSGNEMGANPEWLPGGKLPTGMSEAVIDNIPEGKYIERKLNESIKNGSL